MKFSHWKLLAAAAVTCLIAACAGTFETPGNGVVPPIRGTFDSEGGLREVPAGFHACGSDTAQFKRNDGRTVTVRICMYCSDNPNDPTVYVQYDCDGRYFKGMAGPAAVPRGGSDGSGGDIRATPRRPIIGAGVIEIADVDEGDDEVMQVSAPLTQPLLLNGDMIQRFGSNVVIGENTTIGMLFAAGQRVVPAGTTIRVFGHPALVARYNAEFLGVSRLSGNIEGTSYDSYVVVTAGGRVLTVSFAGNSNAPSYMRIIGEVDR